MRKIVRKTMRKTVSTLVALLLLSGAALPLHAQTNILTNTELMTLLDHARLELLSLLETVSSPTTNPLDTTLFITHETGAPTPSYVTEDEFLSF